MKRYKPIDSYQLSPRIKIVPGDRVRVQGTGSDACPYRLSGTYKLAGLASAARKRVFATLTSEIGSKGPSGTFTIPIAGPNYTRHGVKWTPYTLKRLK